MRLPQDRKWAQCLRAGTWREPSKLTSLWRNSLRGGSWGFPKWCCLCYNPIFFRTQTWEGLKQVIVETFAKDRLNTLSWGRQWFASKRRKKSTQLLSEGTQSPLKLPDKVIDYKHRLLPHLVVQWNELPIFRVVRRWVDLEAWEKWRLMSLWCRKDSC